MNKVTLTTIFLFFIIVKIQAQATINVPADFTTIQLAVDNASANDIIRVADGTYTENVDLSSAAVGITIEAENTGSATINGNTAAVFSATNHTGNITISGFVLSSNLNDNSQGVIFMTNLNGRLTAIANTISANDTNGIFISSPAVVETNASILNNVFGNFGNDDFIAIIIGEDGAGGGNSSIVINGNSNSGIAQDDAISIDLEGNGGFVTTNIINNNFSGWTAAGDGIDYFIGRGSPVGTNIIAHLNISDNTITNVDGNGILINLDGINNEFYGTIVNNTLSGAGSMDRGIYVDSDSTVNGITATLNILDNTITNTESQGMRFRPFSDDANRDTWNLVIDNNDLSNIVEEGILIDGSSGVDDENYTINAEIINNTISSTLDCIVIERPTTTTVATAIVNYETSNNTGCSLTTSGNPTNSTDPVPSSLDLLAIGNTVWHDADGDGLNNNGEVGVEGVVINFSGNGFSGSTITDLNGNYTLPALIPGTYTLTATPTLELPDVTLQNVGSDTTVDNNFSPSNNMTSVVLSAGGSNDDSVDLGILNSSTLSVSALALDSFSIYPNPVENMLVIKAPNADIYTYSVISLQGQLIFESTSTNGFTELDMSSLRRGVYILKLKSNGKDSVFKILKQ